MEGLNNVVGDVYVFSQQSELEGASKQHRLGVGSHVANSIYQQLTEEEFPRIEENNEDQLVEPLGSFRVTGSTWITNYLDLQMNATLVPNDTWEQ